MRILRVRPRFLRQVGRKGPGHRSHQHPVHPDSDGHRMLVVLVAPHLMLMLPAVVHHPASVRAGLRDHSSLSALMAPPSVDEPAR